ncbi:SPOCS domain-containing protein [Clostridium sp. MB05]|jgi:LysM repeat protein
MSQIDVIKEVVHYEQLLRENLTNHVLKGEYLIRDSQYPDMKQVLGVDAKATITNKETLGDKVMVEGQLNFLVFYLPKDEAISESPSNKIHSVIFTDKFANYLDLNNDEHNILCDVECEIEHIEANWMNERKVGLDGIMTLRWEVYKDGEFEYVKDIEGKGDIQTQKKEEMLNGVKGEKEVDLMGKSMLKVTMDKPEIEEVLKCSMNLHKKEIKVVEDKVYVGCYCRIELLYKGKENKELVTLQDDVYLSKEEEMPGISGDMLSSLNMNIKDHQYAVNLDDLGENRVVDIEFLIKGNVKVYSKDKIEMLKDAYCPTMNIDLEKDAKEFGAIHSITNMESMVKDNVELSGKDDRLEQIISVTGTPFITDKMVEDNKVKVEGVVKILAIYKLAGDELNYGIANGEISFITAADIKDAKKGMNALIKVTLENIDASIEGNSIAVKANVGLTIKLCYKMNKECVVGVVEGPAEAKDKKASVTIYVVGEGDTLWSLAKKYNTTMDELSKLNELDINQNIKQGDKLIIPGRAIF